MSAFLASYHLRNHGAGGRTKDWRVEAYDDKVITYWGTTGTNLQKKEFKDLSKFPQNDPTIEALKRRDEKLRKGYWEVDTQVATEKVAKVGISSNVKERTPSETKKIADWCSSGSGWF